MKRLCLLLLVLLLPLAALAEGELTLGLGRVKGYTENSIQVNAPGEGDLLLRIYDQYNLYRTLRFRVKAGENVFTWDGLGENEERIVEREYTLSAELSLDKGGVVKTEQTVTFQRCEQAMTFALPSAAVLYQADDDWFVELDLVRPGTFVVETYAAGDMTAPIAVRRKNADSYDPFKFLWNADGLAPGNYVLRCYAEKNPAYSYDVPVTVKAGSAPVIPLTETETFMPSEEDRDETIWRVMMQPSAVIDLKRSTDHQEVYALPDESSMVLGTLHGQSQAVKVQDIREDDWVRVMAWNHESGAQIEGYVPRDCLMMVQPNAEYGLLLNKVQQTLTVYHRGKRLTTLDISTGLMAQDKLFRETPAGSYLTLEHMSGFASEGYHYDYPIRYDGGNLLHQLGYKERGGRNDFTDHTPQLGSKASHGCIRLPSQVNADGVNAYWLWTHLPYHTRLIILDDPHQRMVDEALANADLTAMPQGLPEVAALPELQDGQTEIVITLGGDVVLGTRESWWKKEESLPNYLALEGMGYPFSSLLPIFEADDMTLVNLECVLKADASGEDKTKQWRFRGLPEYTEVLRLASIEQVNIANNHYIDYGVRGKKATREALMAGGIAFSGQNYTYAWDCNGRRIGFAGIRETTYKQDKKTIARDIAALKSVGCEVIVFSCHWGAEYSALHNEMQQEMAQAAIAAGADIVVGTHPHVVQGIDHMDGGVVLYSLGNLMFGGTHDMTTFDGTLAQLRLRFDKNGYLGCGVELIPVLTSSSAPANDFCPMVAEGADRERILTKIQIDSGVTLRGKMWFPAR
ncbi:MAG: CapA family protein [Clostridia bacterium]|nr:CapA family protein [Clostridia bacterium]